MAQRKIKQLRQPSSGTLRIIEAQNGTLSLKVDVDEQEGTDEAILRRIQAAIAGLAYHYERHADDVDMIGLAFLEGMTLGQRSAMPQPVAEKKKKKKTHYGHSNIGFGADV